MQTRLPFVALLAALGGCGQASEKSFNDSFSEKFRESCVSSTTQGGVPDDIAGRLCDCAIGKINEKYSAVEKLSVPEQELIPLMTECMNSVVQK